MFIFAAVCAVFVGFTLERDALLRGLDAFRVHDFQVAEREFRKAVSDRPKSARAWKLLGMTYIAEEKYDPAEDACRKACELSPQEDNACYYQGRAAFTLGRFDESLAAYEKALANGGGRGRVLLGFALTYEAMLKPREAERYYKNAIEAGAARANVAYGLFLFKQGRGGASLKILRTAGATAEAGRVEAALRHADIRAAGVAAGPVRFAASPLDMVVNNGATGAKRLIETTIAGVGVFDYDGDGWPDIFVANGAAIPSLDKSKPEFFNRLFRNNRDGTFTDVTLKALGCLAKLTQ